VNENSIDFQTSYEKIRAISEKPKPKPAAIRVKTSENAQRKDFFQKADANRGLLEKLEEELENKGYRPRTIPTRGEFEKLMHE
jgi:hypothetical protein